MTQQDVSLDIEETNKLRIRLGLKPLAVTENHNDTNVESESQQHIQANTSVNDDEKHEDFRDIVAKKRGTSDNPILVDAMPVVQEDVSERLERIRRNRVRKDLISGGGISDYIKSGKSIVDISDDEVDPLNIIAWANKMGNKLNRNNVTYYSDEEDNSNSELEGNSRKNVKRSAGYRNDSDVSNYEEDVKSSKIKVVHDMDELELITNDEITLTLKDINIMDQTVNNDENDYLENINLVKKSNKSVSNGNNNYIPFEEEESKNDEKKDKGFFIHVNNNSRGANFKDEDGGNGEDKIVSAYSEETSVVFDSNKKLKLKGRNKAINWDKVFNNINDDEDETVGLNEFKPKVIKKNFIVEDDNDEFLYKHLNRNRKITTDSKIDGVKAVIDTGISQGDNGIEITDTSEFCNILKNPLERIEHKKKSDRLESSNVSRGINIGGTKDEVAINDKPMGNGIMEALAYIKDRGDFIEEKEIRNDEVNLSYIDSYGKEMTPKEAFRRISWVFHGKDPGMNKRDRKYKRMERERLVKENPVHGLPTMKALFTHQQKEETPHLILTGHENI